MLPQGGVAVFDIGEAAVDIPAFGIGFGSGQGPVEVGGIGLVFQVVAPEGNVCSGVSHCNNNCFSTIREA